MHKMVVSMALAPNAGDSGGAPLIEKPEAITSVCSAGLDMAALPGDTSVGTLSAIMADGMAVGVINRKITATRLSPVPGKTAGDHALFGCLLGESVIKHHGQ